MTEIQAQNLPEVWKLILYIYNIQVSKATGILQGYILRLGVNASKLTFVYTFSLGSVTRCS